MFCFPHVNPEIRAQAGRTWKMPLLVETGVTDTQNDHRQYKICTVLDRAAAAEVIPDICNKGKQWSLEVSGQVH